MYNFNEQFNSVFTTPLPSKLVIEPDVFFYVESIAYQADVLILTDINITESIIIDSIRELSSNSAAGPDGIPPSLLLNCTHELAPSLLILFKQSFIWCHCPFSKKSCNCFCFLSRVIEQSIATIAPFLQHLLLSRFLRE